MLFAFNYVYSLVIGIISIISIHIPFIILSFFNVRQYTIDDRTLYDAVSKHISKGIYSTSKFDEVEKPSGFFIGLWYAGMLKERQVTIICHKSMLLGLHKSATETNIGANEGDKKVTHDEKRIKVWLKQGSKYSDMYYVKLTIRQRISTPTCDQMRIIDDIMKIYAEKNTSTFFISGPIGCGKSTLGVLLAERLSGSICYSFNPTTPGDNLVDLLMRKRSSSDDGPLVLLIDEIESIFNKFATIMHDPKLYTEIYDKMTYNVFMDNIYNYSNIILLLTSNMSKKDIDEYYDPSYLREGRISSHYELTTRITF